MPLRVCILAREQLLSWPCYFLRAFRESCEVMAIGAPARRENHDFPDWEAVRHYIEPNDIHSEELDAPALMALLPEGWNPDLVVVIQSGQGLMAGITELGCPTAYLSIDTWHDPREFLHAHQYDFVFLAQKGMVKHMRAVGCCRAFWLPLGCDPRFHYAVAASGEPQFDISFVGSTHFMVNRQRVARLKVLEEHFNLGFTFGLGCDAMAEAYGQTRLIFNASIAKDVNMRVFEALATGVPLVTNREAEANGLFDLFEDEKHLITYTDENLIAQVRRCLDNPEWAAAIGEAGRQEVLARHTYAHRVETLLGIIREHLPSLGQRPLPRLKRGQRVAEFVPFGTRRLLDVGLGLDTSRVALRHQGVAHVAGLAMDPEQCEHRARSYDTTALFSGHLPQPEAPWDTILWNRPLAAGLTMDSVLAQSTPALVQGGRVMIIFNEGELSSLIPAPSFNTLFEWFFPRGYKLLVWRSSAADSDYHLLTLCRYDHCADDVLAQVYAEFPVNGIDTDPGIRLSDVPMPG